MINFETATEIEIQYLPHHDWHGPLRHILVVVIIDVAGRRSKTKKHMNSYDNPKELHRAMIEEWMAQRDKPFSLRLLGGIDYDDGSYISVDAYFPFSQREIECIRRHGEKNPCALDNDPTIPRYSFSKLWQSPDGDEAEALVERIQRRVVGDDGMEGVKEVDLFDLSDPFLKLYRFSILTFENATTPHCIQDAVPIDLPMSDEDYAKLLTALLDDRALDFNRLAIVCPDVYSHLYDQIVDDPYETHNGFSVNGPFILLFSEMQEDALEVAGELPFSGIFMAWEDTRYTYPHVLHLSKLHIEDKRAMVRDMAMPGDGAYSFYEKVYHSIPADDFMKALGASTCEETLQILKRRFGTREAMDQFEDFLVDADIPFETDFMDDDCPPQEWYDLGYEDYIYCHHANEALQEVLDMIYKEDEGDS